jgi:hypothetical protein
MKNILIFCFLLTTTITKAQNVTGVWRGSFVASFFGSFSEDAYKFEVQIDHRTNNARGVTYSYHNTEFYAKAGMKGSWEKSKKKFTLEELQIIEVRKMSNVDACRMTCYLTYSKSGNDEYLIGTYTSVNTTDNSNCGGGTVRLKKVVESVFKKEPFLVRREAEQKQKQIARANQQRNQQPIAQNNSKPKTTKPTVVTAKTKPEANTNPPVVKNDKPNNNPTIETPQVTPKVVTQPTITKVETPPPTVVRNRKNDITESIPLDAENIKINFYDNGEIDGDSISVYVNGKLMLKNQRLTYDPLTLTLKKSELQATNDVVMVAENLGTIPPNTATMIVYVGSKRYEVRLESNNQKNAAVRFEK